MSARRKATLDRRAVVAAILRQRDNALVVAGLGAPCFDVMACGDNPLNFYTWGAMGGTAMIGLGLALAQPKRRVLVITGDGDMLMALGSFATIGAKRPSNLAIVVMDNEHYGETGMQQTHTQLGTEFSGVAKATGFRWRESRDRSRRIYSAAAGWDGAETPVSAGARQQIGASASPYGTRHAVCGFR